MGLQDTRIYSALFLVTKQDIVERSQYFNPFFSWIVVSFTYFSIGIRGGKVWKYLFYCSTAGFLAITLNIIVTLSRKINYRTKQYDNLKYIEGVLWTLTEWGYMYINFIKIRSCIKSLRKKYWNFIMIIILIYSFCIRLYLSYLDKHDNDYEDEDELNRKKDILHGFIFFPLGLVSIIFIFFIVKEFLEETDKKNKNIIYSLLHSTLTRMSFGKYKKKKKKKKKIIFINIYY